MADDHEELPSDKKDDNNETHGATQKDPGDDIIQESEEFTHTVTTEEIIKMYENVEIDLNDIAKISTNDILRMCEDDSNVQESWNVQKSTWKCRKIFKQ